MTEKTLSRVIRASGEGCGSNPIASHKIKNNEINLLHFSSIGDRLIDNINLLPILMQNSNRDFDILQNEPAPKNTNIPDSCYALYAANGGCMRGFKLPNGQDFPNLDGKKYTYCQVLELKHFNFENYVISKNSFSIIARLKDSQSEIAELVITDDDIGIFIHEEDGKKFAKARRIAKIATDETGKFTLTGQYYDSKLNQYVYGKPHNIESLVGIIKYIYPIN